jgi:hypothetical protein
MMRANRAFPVRAVRCLTASAGIPQFPDPAPASPFDPSVHVTHISIYGIWPPVITETSFFTEILCTYSMQNIRQK